MTKAKTIAPQAPKAQKNLKPQKTAADILAMDDRPIFSVDVPEWDLLGDNAAIVQQADTYTVAKIDESSEKTPRGMCYRNAKLIIECCISPKFGPEHIEALALSKSATAIGRLVTAILLGSKKNVSSQI